MGRSRSWAALGVAIFLAGSQLGCPNSGPTQAERNARLAKARLANEAADEAEDKAEAERLSALGTWPPLRGKPFPDMTLFDQEGQEVKLSSFKGKVILLQWVATTSPGSISQAGGFESETFQGTPAQPGVWRLDKELKEAKVPVESEDLVWLQIMVYGPREAVPTQADAQAWAEHFKLSERPRTHVLYTDERYQVEATHSMVPGYFVIGRDFTFAYDRANMFSADGYTEVARGLKSLLRARRPLLPVYSQTISPRRKRLEALAALLKEGKHEELEAEIAQLLAKGYRKDEPGRTHLDTIADLGTVEGVTEEHFAAWVAASPESFVPAYLKGMAHVKWGWKARGHGYANTVTEEGWAIFGRELQKAKEEFTLANRLSSAQAYGYTGLLIVSRALSAPDEVREAYFSAAMLADPEYLAAYEQNLEAIYPKWGGTVEAAQAFVYGSIEKHPNNAALEMLVPRLHYEFSRTVVRNGAAYLAQKKVASDCLGAIRRIREAFPKSREVNRLALRIAIRRGSNVQVSCDRLAEFEDPWGMGQYGYFMKYGRRGIKKDLQAAHELLVAAGRAGDSVAATQVAHSLIHHDDYQHDPARAVPWLEVGVAGGNTVALEFLGDAYRLGQGVPLDLAKAADLYRRSRQRSALQELADLLRAHPELRLPDDPK